MKRKNSTPPASAPVARPDFSQDSLTRQEAADWLRLKVSTLEADAVTRRLGVPFYKIGRRPLYRRSDLAAWVEARRKA